MASLRRFVGKVPLIRRIKIKRGQLTGTTLVKPAIRPWMRAEGTRFEFTREDAKRDAPQFHADVAELTKAFRRRIARTGKRPESQHWRSAKRCLEILQMLTLLPEKPSVTAVIAGLAMSKGLEADRLGPYVSSVRTLEMQKPGLFFGDSSSFISAVKRGVLAQADRVLFEHPGIYTTEQILERIPLPSTQQNKMLVSQAFNVLNAMKLNQKLLSSEANPSMRGVAAEHRRNVESAPMLNREFIAARALLPGPRSAMQLAQATGMADATHVIKRAVAKGLVVATPVKGREKRFALTPKAKTWIKEQLAPPMRWNKVETEPRKTITPAIRRGFLGEKNRNPTSLDEIDRQAVRRWARTRLAIQASPEKDNSGIARELGDAPSYVAGVNANEFPLWGKNWGARMSSHLEAIAVAEPELAPRLAPLVAEVESMVQKMAAKPQLMRDTRKVLAAAEAAIEQKQGRPLPGASHRENIASQRPRLAALLGARKQLVELAPRIKELGRRDRRRYDKIAETMLAVDRELKQLLAIDEIGQAPRRLISVFGPAWERELGLAK